MFDMLFKGTSLRHDVQSNTGILANAVNVLCVQLY